MQAVHIKSVRASLQGPFYMPIEPTGVPGEVTASVPGARLLFRTSAPVAIDKITVAFPDGASGVAAGARPYIYIYMCVCVHHKAR